MSADMIRLAKAYDFAAQYHIDQRRKGAKAEPYTNHLAEVAWLVAEATGGADTNLIIASVLHDTIEDTTAHYEDLVNAFDEDVADLVMEVSDDKRFRKSERKRLQVAHAGELSARARIIKIADKISNIRSIQHSPPAWPDERKRRYFAWSKAVVDAARGVNEKIEAEFDAEYARALDKGIADRNLVWRKEMEVEGDD
jgi:(p)ppGpp synthase/HD superfamily hydrolase